MFFLRGIAAGLLAFGWARAFGEGPVETAIAFESAHHGGHSHEAHGADEHASEAAAAGHDDDEEPEIFSRTVQSGIGLLTGLVVVGAGLGCLFAVLFALAYGRIGALSAGPTAALLSALGLLSVYLVPALKYPANPPAVGEPDTIKMRTGYYFLMVAISIAATVIAWMTRRKLLARHGAWNSSVLAAGVYRVVIALAFTVVPTFGYVGEMTLGRSR